MVTKAGSKGTPKKTKKITENESLEKNSKEKATNSKTTNIKAKEKVAKNKIETKKPKKKKDIIKTIEEKPANNKALEKKINTEGYHPNDKEEYMCDKHLEYFENKLLMWKKSIMEKNEQAISTLQAESGAMADLNDRATLEEEFTLTLREQDRERRLVQKINKAVERIHVDDFGFCDRCGAEIGLRRLEARLTAELCIDCKELQEKREKTMND